MPGGNATPHGQGVKARVASGRSRPAAAAGPVRSLRPVTVSPLRLRGGLHAATPVGPKGGSASAHQGRADDPDAYDTPRQPDFAASAAAAQSTTRRSSSRSGRHRRRRSSGAGSAPASTRGIVPGSMHGSSPIKVTSYAAKAAPSSPRITGRSPPLLGSTKAPRQTAPPAAAPSVATSEADEYRPGPSARSPTAHELMSPLQLMPPSVKSPRGGYSAAASSPPPPALPPSVKSPRTPRSPRTPFLPVGTAGTAGATVAAPLSAPPTKRKRHPGALETVDVVAPQATAPVAAAEEEEEPEFCALVRKEFSEREVTVVPAPVPQPLSQPPLLGLAHTDSSARAAAEAPHFVDEYFSRSSAVRGFVHGAVGSAHMQSVRCRRAITAELDRLQEAVHRCGGEVTVVRDDAPAYAQPTYDSFLSGLRSVVESAREGDLVFVAIVGQTCDVDGECMVVPGDYSNTRQPHLLTGALVRRALEALPPNCLTLLVLDSPHPGAYPLLRPAYGAAADEQDVAELRWVGNGLAAVPHWGSLCAALSLMLERRPFCAGLRSLEKQVGAASSEGAPLTAPRAKFALDLAKVAATAHTVDGSLPMSSNYLKLPPPPGQET